MITVLQKGDIPAIVALEAETFPDPWSKSGWESAFARSDFFGFVVKEGEALVGFVCGTSLFEESELLKIAIAKEKRGQGYGKRLLVALQNEAKSRGAQKMFLEVREGNIPAKNLYLQNGFLSSRVRKNYYADGETAVEMYAPL